MFGFFRKKTPTKELVFKSTEAAFEYATKFMANTLAQDCLLYGLVIGLVEQSYTLLGTPRMSQQLYRVKLATDSGIVEVDNCGSIVEDFSGREPIPGDLVAVRVASYNPKYAPSDPKSLNYFLIEVIVLPRIGDLHQFVPLVDEELVKRRLKARQDRSG